MGPLEGSSDTIAVYPAGADPDRFRGKRAAYVSRTQVERLIQGKADLVRPIAYLIDDEDLERLRRRALVSRNTADLRRRLPAAARRHRLARAVRDPLRGPRHPRLLRVGRPRAGGARAPGPSRVRAAQGPQHRRARGSGGWTGGGPQLVPVVSSGVENLFAIIGGGRDTTGHTPGLRLLSAQRAHWMWVHRKPV